LKSSQGKLQEYVLKNGGFHLKKWPRPDLNNATQDQWYHLMSSSK